MYLSKLEMVGFKSFALKTDLTFTDGVTAIVGPNGCGKSNIVDAIRWVLGEQKSSTLRADSMDQVIFNGSKTRKPLGMAEVSLTIENNKQILPTEYTQVVISRRLFRSGESQYLLNRTQCRLRDIIDLFMDTGMGSDAYSVIELKMIETILSDKADERRHLFEEAAGVTKYKARRREAQRKLDAAQRDIARVQDIVREVQKTVNSLARQAEKARQHQELSTELRELDRLLFAFEYADEYAQLQVCVEKIAAARLHKEQSDADVAKAEQASFAAEQQQHERDHALRQALDLETTVRSAVADVQQRSLVVEERLVAARRTHDRLEREQHESQSQAMSTEDELRRVVERIGVASEALEEAIKAAEYQRSMVAEQAKDVENARSATAHRREALTQARQHLSEQQNLADRLRVQHENMLRRVRENETQQVAASERHRAVSEQMHREQTDIPMLDAALAEAEQSLHLSEQRLVELRSEQEQLQTEADGLRARNGHNKASLEFLIGLVDTTESSRFLLSTPEWTPSGEKLTLAEVLNADEHLRVAIEAALGDAARYFVVGNRAEADAGISALSKHQAGKATFLCRDSVPSIDAPSAPLGSDVVGWASELVRVDEGLRGAVRSIIGRTIVVSNTSAAWQALRENSHAMNAVTLAGEIVHRSGAVRGGSASKTEGVRVGRRERIEDLRSEVAALEERLASIEQRLAAIRSETSSIDLRALGDVVRRAAVQRNERIQRLDNLRGRMDDAEQQQRLLQEELERLAAEHQSIIVAGTEAEGTVATAADAVVLAEQDLANVQHGVAETELRLNDATRKAREAEILVVRLTGEVQGLSSDQQRLQSQSLTIDQRREQRNAERSELAEQIATLEREKALITDEAARCVSSLAEARANRESLELSVQEAQATFHAANEAVRRLRKDQEVNGDAVHEADLKLSEVRIRVETLVRRATEELDMPAPEHPEVPDTALPRDDIKQSVQDLRRKLTGMGNVNFLALEEHERENERLTFLTTQLNDLQSSEQTLTLTIAEINQTAKEKFTTTFDRIRQNFIELFKVLFTEDDEADLQMVDDADPLECTIEIQAKPRGKRPHSIEMLSGGEKTLTAIALLFAIYLVKPSPFCILDEVDAPLDDANIDRYLKLIRKFSENTQFLMITHNKKTMEAADTLYGVTMEEAAISKTVSVRLAGEAA